jgi:acyl-CoA synthetase (NDP forming)
MIDEIKGRAVLDGARGGEPADIGALAGLLLKLSAFAEANPQVEELDLNPVFAYEDGCIAVDARIVVSAES